MASNPEPPSERVLVVPRWRASLRRLSQIPGSLKESADILPAAKFIIILTVSVTICLIALQNPNDILRSKKQFKAWYSQYVYQFTIIARDNCSEPYSVYLYGTRQNTSDVTLHGAGKFTLFVQPMINCLLENASEYIKYQLSSSQVMLGITPTIIALLGASSEELCLFALVGRRRLLGLLLSAASPSIYTERAFKYQDGDKILKDLDSSHVNKNTVIRGSRPLFVSLEYIAVLGAIANIATLNWQLGLKSINTVNANTVFMPMLWSFLGVTAHLAGAVVFNMRARRLTEENKPLPRLTPNLLLQALQERIRSPRSAIRNMLTAFWEMAYREFFWLPEKSKEAEESKEPEGPKERIRFCLIGESRCFKESKELEGPKERIRFRLIGESPCFIFLAWFHSVLVILHIILGTLILSSTTFLGPKDALGIMARYIVSVIICRVILVYELAVLEVEYVGEKVYELAVLEVEYVEKKVHELAVLEVEYVEKKVSESQSEKH